MLYTSRDTEKNIFSANLIKFRTENNLTQLALSKITQISRSQISNYENGTVPYQKNLDILNEVINNNILSRTEYDEFLKNNYTKDTLESNIHTDIINFEYINELNNAKKLNYINGNKDIEFKKICGVYIKNFRTLKDRYIPLGENLTIISGKNGTMKSTLLGLIAHPFSPPDPKCKDFFGVPLKTDMRNVFKLSPEKDSLKDYHYSLHAITSKSEEFAEPIRVYYSESDSRHRITVGGNLKGQGNFSLNTSYINLKRLYPIIDTNSKPTKESIDLDYLNFVSKVHNFVFTRDTFKDVEAIEDGKIKNTFGPKNTYYDYNSISSGEDNLGFIINKLYAFQTNKNKSSYLQGILCIDEIDAGLHPVAQENLINFLLDWSRKNNVQIICTTHSLYLIQTIIKLQNDNHNSINLVMLSTQFVDDNNYNIKLNPKYSDAYKELTFKNFEDNHKIFKPTIIMEDEIAIGTLKKIIKKKDILNSLNFVSDINIDSDNPGISYNAILSLIKNGHKLFEDIIFILDGDMDKSTSETIDNLFRKKANVLKLPSFHNLPVEKEIIKYIYDLKPSDDFFIKEDKEKTSFINDFNRHDIRNLCDLEEIRKMKTRKFKNWRDYIGNQTFMKYLTYYISSLSTHESFEDFNEKFKFILNKIYSSKSLPTIE